MLLWGLLVGSCTGLAAQNARHPAYIRYGVNDGLPNKELYCVMRDREGFIWFGTDAGVARFDGHHMRVYDSRDGLPDKAILQIRQDRTGRIWFFTASGQLSYLRDRHFYSAQNDSVLAALTCKNAIISFHEDANGDIYFGSMGGEIKCLRKNGCAESLTDLIQPRWVLAFASYQHMIVAGSMLAGHISVDTLDAHHGIRCVDVSISGSYTSSFPIKGIFHSNGEFWCTTGRKVMIVPPSGDARYYEGNIPEITKGRIVYVGENRDGKVWIGTSKGAFLFANSHLEQGPIMRVLPHDEVRYVMEDEENGTWFATTQGAVFIPNHDIKVGFHPSYPFGDLEVRSMERTHDGKYLAAVFPIGFFLLDNNLHVLRHWPTNPDSLFELPLGVHQVDAQTLYTTSISKTFILKDGDLEEVQRLVYADYQAYRDSLCICTSYGWYIVDPKLRNTYLWGSKELPIRDSRQPQRCYELETDTQGRLWIANTTGIFRYEKGRLDEMVQAKPYMQGKTLCMQADPSGGMWIGTNSNGLLYAWEDSVWRISAADGLAADQINDIDIAADGTIWTAASGGISRIRFNRKTHASVIDNLYSEGGLPNQSATQILVAGDSVLVVMGPQVLVFSQRLLDETPRPPTPKLLSLSVMGLDTLLQDGLQLPYGSGNLLFKFTAIGFRGRRDIAYRYRLQGEAEPWTQTDGEEISFVALPPGEYTFELQAKSQGSTWSTATAHLRFQILKPYWQRAWFIVLSVLALLGGGMLVVAWIFFQAKRRNERRQRLVQAEHRALVTQMNPHFISNSLQSIQSYFINRDLETANDYMADFSELMRSILDSSRTYCTTLSSELRLIQLYLQMEQMRTSDGFDFEIVVDPTIQADRFLLPPLLLQPFLENAIWHGIVPKGRRGKVRIQIEPVQDAIRVMIIDDGIGRTASQAAKAKLITTRKSHATDIVHERIELLNQHRKLPFKFWIVDREDAEGRPEGTTVFFILPSNFKESHDQNHPD